ncbi:hypothetical protein BGZ89_006809 [Linnemannia elongata]|nr:hypothetical protein BGZ89_006809 [Linnemannia elongata]
MQQGDYPLENVQAIRSVDKSISPNSVPLATPEEIYHVETQVDPDTNKDVVLWDDILQAFENAVQVRHKTKVVPFLKGKDLRILQPRRIAAVPNIVLDAIVDTPVTENMAVTSLQIQHLALQPAPLQDYDNRSQLGRIQIATTDVPMEKDIAQTSISASRGDKYAQVALGDKYRDGKGVPRDYQAAMYWYLKAVEQGDGAGQQRVGDLYAKGLGVSQKYSIAMDWYLKAAEQGHAESQYRIGLLYRHGQGVPQNYKQALEWHLKAANQGHADSQYYIGFLYDNGQSVPQDYVPAMEWYLKAANQGHARSQYNIGCLYDNGRGVPQDYAHAMKWYLKAANQGHARSQYSIGIFYDYGQGVPKNYAQAMEWYLKAANQGHNRARRALDALKKKGVALNQKIKM